MHRVPTLLLASAASALVAAPVAIAAPVDGGERNPSNNASEGYNAETQIIGEIAQNAGGHAAGTGGYAVPSAALEDLVSASGPTPADEQRPAPRGRGPVPTQREPLAPTTPGAKTRRGVADREARVRCHRSHAIGHRPGAGAQYPANRRNSEGSGGF